jgi:hypothetical protein
MTAGLGNARSDATAPRAAAETPALPSVGNAFREALNDFYFNSWRLAPANVAWGIGLIAVLALGVTWIPALALAAALAIPTAGIFRMAAIAVRGDGLRFSDLGAGMARFWRPALVIGAGSLVLAVVFSVNMVIGLEAPGPAGWLFGALALYGNVGLAMMLVAFWPILVDPRRADRSIRDCLRLALLVNLARPARMAVVTILLGVILVISTVFFAILLTAAVAYVSLVATRCVLPIADRIEGRTGMDQGA